MNFSNYSSVFKILIAIIIFISCIENNFSQSPTNPPDTLIIKLKKYNDFPNWIMDELLDSYLSENTLYCYKPFLTTKKVYRFDEALDLKIPILTDKKYCLFFTRNGRLIAEGNWTLEVYDGSYKEYYRSGELKVKGYFASGSKENKWEYFDKSGKIMKEEIYKNGVIQASSIF